MVHREAENGEGMVDPNAKKYADDKACQNVGFYFLVPSSSPRSISCHLTMPLRDHVPKSFICPPIRH
jgi:hypothetical protein